MSCPVEVYSESRTIEPVSGAFQHALPNGRYLFRTPLKWDQDIALEIRSFLMKLEYPFRTAVLPFKEPYRSEFFRFLLSLDAYHESPNPVMPDNYLLIGSTMKDFATTLKRIKRKSFLTTWSADTFEVPDWWNSVDAFEIKDIGDIFNYSYLPFWEETCEDYLEGFIPIKELTLLQEFRETLANQLGYVNSIDAVDPQEILLQSSSSKSFVSERSQYNFKHKAEHLSFSRKRQPVKRTVIPVSPGNVRDSVLNSIEDLNTISLIDRNVEQVLKQLRYHIQFRDSKKVLKRLLKLNKFSYFLHRDIKKEGITKPRILLKVMLEELHKVFPEVECFGWTEFFDDFPLVMEDGKIVYPDRGHGLGMANSLTTLMQIVLIVMILERVQETYPETKITALVLNDDFVAAGDSLEELEEFWDCESEILDGLQLIREPQKSFISHFRFVLCERYFYNGVEYPKVSYKLRDQYMGFACYNIVHAKDYISCLPEVKPMVLHELVNFWGYEFYPREVEYPAMVGGWIQTHYEGVSLDLKLLEDLPYNSNIPRAYKACRYKFKKKKTNEVIVKSPFSEIFNIQGLLPEFNDLFGLMGPTERQFRYLKFADASSFMGYWDQMYKKRRERFNQPLSLPFTELVDLIIKDHPTTDFVPLDFMIEKYCPAETIFTKIRDVYLSQNPLLSYLAYLGYIPNSQIIKEDFSIHFVDPEITIKGSRDLLPRDVVRQKNSERAKYLSLYDNSAVLFCEEMQDSYLNPIRVGLYFSSRGFMEVPILKECYISPLIEKKRAVFGRFLTIQELSFVIFHALTREQIYYLVNMPKAYDEDESLSEDSEPEDPEDTEDFARSYIRAQIAEQERLEAEMIHIYGLDRKTTPTPDESDEGEVLEGTFEDPGGFTDIHQISLDSFKEEGLATISQSLSPGQRVEFENSDIEKAFNALLNIIMSSNYGQEVSDAEIEQVVQDIKSRLMLNDEETENIRVYLIQAVHKQEADLGDLGGNLFDE